VGVQLFALFTRNGQRQLLNMALLITTAMFRKTMLFLNPASRFFAEKLDTRTRLHPVSPNWLSMDRLWGSPRLSMDHPVCEVFRTFVPIKPNM
jgi:hypothetical protein